MDAKLTRRQVREVTVVDLTGRVTLGEGASLLRDEIRELAAGGVKAVLVNLAGVTYIDSAGIGELVSGMTTIGHAGGTLKLAQTGKRVLELLRATRLHTVFQMFDDEAAAVRSFD